jgi:hypothetical protein
MIERAGRTDRNLNPGAIHNGEELTMKPTIKREPASRRHRFLHDLKWIAILWCVGFGATVLLTLPIHYLVMAMIRK